MPSVNNHSPATAGVSRAGFPPPETGRETDPFAALLEQSDRLAAWVIEVEADPVRQAALAELIVQSDRAVSVLSEQQGQDYPLPTGDIP